MALSLVCSCGARFEVEDTLAGQAVACPECQQAVTAPVATRRPLRTSGFAVASVVLALVLAFTGVGTVVAVILGSIGLVHIRRHRDQVTGTGYALLGITLGVLFTVLFAFAIMQTELFGLSLIREGRMGSQVDRTGPMEVSRRADGFTLRRPTTQWGVANDELLQELSPNSELLLANLAKDAYLDVATDRLGGRTLAEYKQAVLDTYKEQRQPNGKRDPLQFRGLQVLKSESLPAGNPLEGLEVLLEVRIGAQPLLFLLRVVRAPGSDRVYVIRGWAQKRRFPTVEHEIREAMDSFRLEN